MTPHYPDKKNKTKKKKKKKTNLNGINNILHNLNFYKRERQSSTKNVERLLDAALENFHTEATTYNLLKDFTE